jgi:hypothetical protein
VRFGAAGHSPSVFYHHDSNEEGILGSGHHPGPGSHPGGLRFGSWEHWSSGYQYERDPDGNYTGRWSS